MSQITLYLDDDSQEKMKEAARAAGVSQSRWVVDLIRARTAQAWPSSVVDLAGSWADMPEVDELREGAGKDVPREAF